MKNILLVEDDFLNRRLTKKVLAEHGHGILEAKNAAEALNLLNKEKVDFIIVDINLGEAECDGISLGQQILEKYGIPFSYLTAYDNSAVMSRAIATAPYSYITKPFKPADLLAAVELGIRQSATQQKRRPTIVVKDDDFNTELLIEDICYIEADKNYVLLHTADKIFKTRNTIKQIMEQLPQSSFIQTHRAFVVNRKKIDKFTVKTLVVNKTEIPVSKNYIDDIESVFK